MCEPTQSGNRRKRTQRRPGSACGLMAVLALFAFLLTNSPTEAQQFESRGWRNRLREHTNLRQPSLGSLGFLPPERLPQPPSQPLDYHVDLQSFPQFAAEWSGGNTQTASAVAPYLATQALWQDQSNENLPGLEIEGPALDSQDAADGAEGAEGDERIGEAESLGQEPEDRSLVFLRRETVLLSAGECQVDLGLTYSLTENVLPVALTDDQGELTGVVGARLRRRLLLMPFEIRYGLTDHVQWFFNAPVGWSGTELSFPELDEFSSVGGIADINSGASFLLKQSQRHDAEIIGTLAMTFPTGNDSFPVLGATPDSQLGQGFFALSINFLFIHTFDPLVIFYGGGYRHRFDDDFIDNHVDPGEQFLYQMGLGFAINESVTLSGSMLGLYITENHVNGRRVEGSILEPIRLRFSATISSDVTLPGWRCYTCRRTIMEPFAEIGMTDDAPSARFGMIWTF